MYYIYHIPNIKIGCSKNPKRRVKQQGYDEFTILETHTDIQIASERERLLQKEYGFKMDNTLYSQTISSPTLEGIKKGGQYGSLKKWIEENRSLLQPPVGNKNLYVESEDYVIMIVGGPNARKDYHYNETEEWFFQVEGSVMIGVQEDGKAIDIEVKEGEMFLLPPRTPHQPRRGEGTVGIVIEVKRAERELKDGLLWFCEKCNQPLHETYFVLENIEKDFLPRFKEFYGNEEMRTCKSCGHLMETDPKFV